MNKEYSKEQFVKDFYKVARSLDELNLLFKLREICEEAFDRGFGWGADCGIQLICDRFGVESNDFMTVSMCDFVNNDDLWYERYEEKASALYDMFLTEVESGDIV